MLGFLQHPNPKFPRLTQSEFNRLGPPTDPTSPKIYATPSGSRVLAVSPDHSHRGVIHQLFGVKAKTTPIGLPTSSGFLNDYEEFAKKKLGTDGEGQRIMGQLHPSKCPILAQLALSFGTLTQWYCSVPGETWPNRNFAHAATSDGEVNIEFRTYRNKTIFELLGESGQTWGIFHDGIPQVFAFPALWSGGDYGVSEDISELERRIANDELPAYSFIEPEHLGGKSNSQHPGNNQTNERDFLAAEHLIGRIYNALRQKPDVFERSLLLITYDEHGGHFDHIAPPRSDAFKDGHVGDDSFRFDLLGPRVPTIAISPFIDAGFVDDTTIYDHSSIVRTVREGIVPQASPLPNTRDGATGSVLPILTRTTPRTQSEMPDLGALDLPLDVAPLDPVKTRRESRRPATELDDFQKSLYWLARTIDITRDEAVANAKLHGAKLDANAYVALAAGALSTTELEATLATKTVGDIDREMRGVLLALRRDYAGK